MTQASDIVLGTDPYMLVGERGRDGYVRSQDGIDEGRTARVMQTDFFGGLGRALQLENDRGWDGLMVGPAHGGQGIRPWPSSASASLDPASPLADVAWEYPSALIGEYVYYGVGQYLYRTVTTTTTAWTAPTMVYDAGAGNIITGLCYYGGNILITFGATKEVTHVLYPNATSPTVLFAGERGHQIAGYQGYAIWSDARAPGTGWANMLRMVTGTGIQFRWLDSPVKRLTTAQAAVIAATASAVYSYAGRVAEFTVGQATPSTNLQEVLRWTGDVTPYFQHGTATRPDDFRFILGFGGKTYAWIGGMVLEHDPTGERAGWRDTGLSGVHCRGACVAAGYLVLSIVSHDNQSELWAWDGSGWWIIHRTAWNGSNEYLQPIALAGAGGYDVGAIQRGSRTMRLYRLSWRSATLHDYPGVAGSSYTSSMIDAGERDKPKAWRKIGAVFASPDLPGNVSSTLGHEVELSYSIDAGLTWAGTVTALQASNTSAGNTFTLERTISSNAAVSPFVQLRVRWLAATDWAPILVGLWVEYEVMESPARRRRWQFTVRAEDQVIDRDGGQLTRTGRQLIAELWSHWHAGAVLDFRDIDYDADPAVRKVRIVGIEEAVPLPHQSGLWGQSTVSLTLVEV